MKHKNPSQEAATGETQCQDDLAIIRKKAVFRIFVADSIFDYLSLVLIAFTIGLILVALVIPSLFRVELGLLALFIETVGIFGLRFYKYRQAQLMPDMESHLNEIKALLAPKNEPNVCIQKAHVTLTPNKSPMVILHMLNNGTDIAYGFDTRSFCALEKVDFTGPLDYPLEENADAQADILKDVIISVIITWDRHVDAPHIALINEQKLLFFVYIETSYRNISGSSYPGRNCWLYDPTIKQLIIAPSKYWPKTSYADAGRACLDVASIVLKGDVFEAGKVPQIEYHIKNIGNAPAFDVKGTCRVFVSNKTTIEELEKDSPPTIEKAKIGNRIGAGDKKIGFSQGIKPISAGVLLDLQLQKCQFFCFVNLFYAGGERKEDVFRYMWHSNRKSFVLFPK